MAKYISDKELAQRRAYGPRFSGMDYMTPDIGTELQKNYGEDWSNAGGLRGMARDLGNGVKNPVKRGASTVGNSLYRGAKTAWTGTPPAVQTSTYDGVLRPGGIDPALSVLPDYGAGVVRPGFPTRSPVAGSTVAGEVPTIRRGLPVVAPGEYYARGFNPATGAYSEDTGLVRTPNQTAAEQSAWQDRLSQIRGLVRSGAGNGTDYGRGAIRDMLASQAAGAGGSVQSKLARGDATQARLDQMAQAEANRRTSVQVAQAEGQGKLGPAQIDAATDIERQRMEGQSRLAMAKLGLQGTQLEFDTQRGIANSKTRAEVYGHIMNAVFGPNGPGLPELEVLDPTTGAPVIDPKTKKPKTEPMDMREFSKQAWGMAEQIMPQPAQAGQGGQGIADLNGDGKVDITDLMLSREAWYKDPRRTSEEIEEFRQQYEHTDAYLKAWRAKNNKIAAANVAA